MTQPLFEIPTEQVTSALDYLKRNMGRIEYPIYGCDLNGEFRIDEPPGWVQILHKRGISVSLGAWGIKRIE